jgi:hypothetical protein
VTLPSVFDLRGEPHQLTAREWSPSVTRDPAELRGVILHAWGTKVGTEGRFRRKFGEPLALARRGLQAPYTISAGVDSQGRPVVSLAHPVQRYTHASDNGNAHFIAVGIFGRFAYDNREHSPSAHTAESDALLEAIDLALREAVKMLTSDGPHLLVTHRQACNGARDHFACPGESVVAMALKSSVVTEGLLIADSDLVLAPPHSKPWPEHWRRHLGASVEVPAHDVPRTHAVCDAALSIDARPAEPVRAGFAGAITSAAVAVTASLGDGRQHVFNRDTPLVLIDDDDAHLGELPPPVV